jgi:hypothetical protein
MAISKNLILIDNYGIEVGINNAYIRIASIEGNKNSIRVLLETWNSDKTKNIKVEQITFAPSLDGKNFISQAYDHIKTLPEFDNSIDC